LRETLTRLNGGKVVLVPLLRKIARREGEKWKVFEMKIKRGTKQIQEQFLESYIKGKI
jgi:hypothetical protein